MKNRMLVVVNDRKIEAQRLRALARMVGSRFEEVPNVQAAARSAAKRAYCGAVIVVPPKWESVLNDIDVLRRASVPILLYAEEDIDVEYDTLVTLGVIEVVPATTPEDELIKRMKRFVDRNTDEFFQSYDEATRSGSSTAGYVPMDDESTCWFCLEQGKASVEHGNLDSARKWLHLVLRIESSHAEAQRLERVLANAPTECRGNGTLD